MATTKVGVYRSFYGSVPTDSSGRPLPESEWLKKRPFSWVVRWFSTDGNRYSRSFRTRKEAERFAEERQSDVREGKADLPQRITVGDYFREHGALMKGSVAPKTLHIHLAALGLLADAVGWDRPLGRITTRDVERFRATRLATGIAPASANRELRALKRIFSLAVARGYIAEGANPCRPLSLLKVGRKRPPYCSAEDFQAVLRLAQDPGFQAMLVVIYTTGLRVQEALNLTWGDIDFAAGQVHVTRKSADGLVQEWRPKDHEMRSVPLPPQAIDLLTNWQSLAPENCPYIFMEAGRWDYYRQRVDAGQWRGGQWLINNVLRRFQTLCRKAGIEAFTLHDLRRSCITNWAAHLPIHVVQQLAGHSDIKTTQHYYLAVRAEDLSKAQAVQAQLLGPVAQAGATDQLLTKSASVRRALGQRLSRGLSQATQKQGLGKRTLQDSNLQPTAP